MNPPPASNGPQDVPAVPPPSPPQYEFDAEQNQVIDDLAVAMRWVTLPLLVAALLYAIWSIVHFTRVRQDVLALIPAGVGLLGTAFFYLLSSWLDKAAAAFDRVTVTSGYDITHLMVGLGQLRRTFGLLAALVKLYLLLLFVLVILFVGVSALGR